MTRVTLPGFAGTRPGRPGYDFGVPQHFGLFLLGSILITIVPGADMALITRQVVTRGRGAAQATIFGNLTGILVHAFALAIGLSALLVAC
jgi:threonine/homoserine/homoserine lactone efflux protein